MDEITAGGMVLQGHTVPVFGAKLLVLQAANGMLGCGYLNVATADKLGHALAIVTGVSGYADMLSAEVRQVSAAARERGVVPGMTGLEALKRLN